jgi:amino acid permease
VADLQFKLKDGWVGYLASGFCLGILFVFIVAIQNGNSPLDTTTILAIVFIIALVALFFAMGSHVKNKLESQNALKGKAKKNTPK